MFQLGNEMTLGNALNLKTGQQTLPIYAERQIYVTGGVG